MITGYRRQQAVNTRSVAPLSCFLEKTFECYLRRITPQTVESHLVFPHNYLPPCEFCVQVIGKPTPVNVEKSDSKTLLAFYLIKVCDLEHVFFVIVPQAWVHKQSFTGTPDDIQNCLFVVGNLDIWVASGPDPGFVIRQLHWNEIKTAKNYLLVLQPKLFRFKVRSAIPLANENKIKTYMNQQAVIESLSRNTQKVLKQIGISLKRRDKDFENQNDEDNAKKQISKSELNCNSFSFSTKVPKIVESNHSFTQEIVLSTRPMSASSTKKPPSKIFKSKRDVKTKRFGAESKHTVVYKTENGSKMAVLPDFVFETFGGPKAKQPKIPNEKLNGAAHTQMRRISGMVSKSGSLNRVNNIGLEKTFVDFHTIADQHPNEPDFSARKQETHLLRPGESLTDILSGSYRNHLRYTGLNFRKKKS